MPLPPSLLQYVENHGCFTGCYGSDSGVMSCLDVNQPLAPLVVVTCLDCLNKVGVLRSLLQPGTTTYTLADAVTQHLRAQRGFTLSLGGYHARGPGFWLSAVYFGNCGVFLLNGERSRQLGSDLDLLLLAFKHGVAQPHDRRMHDAQQYATQTVYLNCAAPLSPVPAKQSLLASPHVQTQPRPGWQRVTLAEFLPTSRAAAPPAAVKPPAAGKPSPALKLGDICPKCKAEVRERYLLQGKYIGCLC